MKRLHLLLFLLVFSSLSALAQNDEINTIRVKKKPVVVPDTGRYRTPTDWDIYDGFPRPMCAFRSYTSPAHVYFIAAYEYQTYSYLKLGVRSARPLPFQTSIGAVIQGNIDHKIIGAGLFAEKVLYTHESGKYSVGARANSFIQKSGDFHTFAPYVSYSINRLCLQNFHLSYGYNLVIANNTRAPEGAPRPDLKINTHNFTITYILPFYL